MQPDPRYYQSQQTSPNKYKLLDRTIRKDVYSGSKYDLYKSMD
jgi:hypothetical protein